jgi:RNA polymerase sigma-70 factor (ECF subfamily)
MRTGGDRPKVEMNVLMSSLRPPLAVRPAPTSAASAASDERAGMTADDVARLIERAQHGDRKAFGELYRHHLRSVYHYIWLQVHDEVTAEDLTQDVFLSILRGIAGFRLGEAFTPWLMRVAHNQVANYWRSLGRRPQTVRLPEEDDPDEDQAPLLTPETPESFVLDVSAPELASALDRLTDLQREVILLRFGAELSLAETASTVGRTVNAVKNIEFKALFALRRQLGALEGRA